MNKEIEMLEIDGQVYLSFGFDEDELLEIEMDEEEED